MNSKIRTQHLQSLLQKMRDAQISTWEELDQLLNEIRDAAPVQASTVGTIDTSLIARGTAFITFDYGIDGVSIEISKYAHAIERIYQSHERRPLHFIGGDFYPQAESVLDPNWLRFHIEGINGWSKWEGGRWFAKLYYEDMPEGSAISSELAAEITRQAVAIAARLGEYVIEHEISLLIPVNIASNPGNLALTLAFIMVTEGLGLYTINSNHDFYWEGGQPASEKQPGDPPGVRDHFFHNIDNQPFFSLFKRLYPWNGRRWLQVNINRLQSRRLIEEFGFPEHRVFELSTAVSDKFFEDYSQEQVRHARKRMAHILSDGQPILHPLPIEEHLAELKGWMTDQQPRILGTRTGLMVDPTSERLIYLLQPTRVVARKRIERDLHLMRALLEYTPFRRAFEQEAAWQILLHITGPTPIEHQEDLEVVLHAYREVLQAVPDKLADRIFLAFSVGHEDHPSFRQAGWERMTIEDIYRMASAVVFPSETEGRGLPIVEASASMVPLICSRYKPEQVFADVVGEGLPPEQQIQYTLFPERDFPETFLREATDLLLQPHTFQRRLQHNREAVRQRYSGAALVETFARLMDAV